MSRSSLIRAIAWTAVALFLALPLAAIAHGPTVQVSYGAVKPKKLVLRVGETVHFQNQNVGAGDCTIVAEDGAFESPTLPSRKGWHYTFEKAGYFRYQVKEFSSAKGEIIVVEKEE